MRGVTRKRIAQETASRTGALFLLSIPSIIQAGTTYENVLTTAISAGKGVFLKYPKMRLAH